MSTKNSLSGNLYMNITTISEYDSLESLESVNKFKSELWKSKCKFLKDHVKENEFLDVEHTLYTKKASSFSEFGKIACVSFGLIGYDSDGDKTIQIRSYSGDNEMQILQDSVGLIEYYCNNSFQLQIMPKLSGFFIKSFGYPFFSKRLLINNVKLPDLFLGMQESKPWEMPILDIADVWNCNIYNQHSSLEQISESMYLPQPNEILKTKLDDLNKIFYKTKGYDFLRNYCENDLSKSINLLCKCNNIDVITNFKNI